VALYLANVAERATSFAVIKSASAAIAYFQKINLFEHNPTISPLASFVRAAFARRLGTAPKRRKAPFLWADVMRFATAYLSGSPAYCHLVVVTCCIISFGGMCRFGELVATRPADLVFSNDDCSVTIGFPKRKMTSTDTDLESLLWRRITTWSARFVCSAVC
jgi:integrase